MFSTEQKKELRKINRKSSEIMESINKLAQEDPWHPFSRRALDLDRQVEYADDVNAELRQMHATRDQEALKLVQDAGALTTAHAMRRYCEVLSDKEASAEKREKAIVGAVQLLFIISRIGNQNTTNMNQKVMETAARDASMKDIYRVTKRQFAARRMFYTPEVIQDIRQNSRV